MQLSFSWDRPQKRQKVFVLRRYLVLSVLLGSMFVLGLRGAQLHLFENDFLRNKGDQRHLRTISIAADRGVITDRHGEPVAISTPVDSVWANPSELITARDQWGKLAQILDINPEQLQQHLMKRSQRGFVYLKRHVNPEVAQKVKELALPGIALQREYRRYYPAGEVMGHVIGFTDIDDNGQEGLELTFNELLKGTDGSKRIMKDNLGRAVETVENIVTPHAGKPLTLSIDQQLQYITYRELKAAVKKHKARAGTAVIMDANTGEVLAMVNQPAFNPNDRSRLRSNSYRNRAVTDVFEPGSTIKPFTIAAALESGRFHARSRIDTSPGTLKVGRKLIRDIRDHGIIDMATVLQKSSNVGATKMALSIKPEYLWQTLSDAGFGKQTNSVFPGESSGLLSDYQNWNEIEHATHAYGYGMSVTNLQLARAYVVLANGGRLLPVSVQRRDDAPEGFRVMHEKTVKQVLHMMESVIEEGGSGELAKVAGYRVAGKTGTVHKAGPGGYQEDKYLSMFAGVVPASRPRLVMTIMIDEPKGKEYFGGRVAAPVFANVMRDALRLMDIAPDDKKLLRAQMLPGSPMSSEVTL
ncbi:MAG: penicillin-binding transpeptidase domain-containing protein [Gammaproteobacteria bacterium]|nr:penicillin-binding transpeptidase domain-containing protein [Gammaproteobacteria bacterium]MDH5594417.1 penicillin-binding transpeptidase domain-containing protein [Gammaproteobacteria bacterium]MDH5613500.1 penicillin-binding transpeptidase domain-containing protein [Gammaproteobacteria bacterium]